MFCFHMSVCLRTHVENSLADPADMSSTRFALDVIAAFRLLNRGSTPQAITRTVILLPLLESFVADDGTFVLVACKAFVVDSSALGAD